MTNNFSKLHLSCYIGKECDGAMGSFFPSMFFCRRQKNKYRWFKVEGFGGGGGR